MYLAVVAICLLTYGPFSQDQEKFVILLIVLSILLCVVSFFLVTFLPKIFLNRKFRNWKFEKASELEDQATIEKIWSSKLPYVRMEAISGVVAMAVSCATLVSTIWKLFH